MQEQEQEQVQERMQEQVREREREREQEREREREQEQEQSTVQNISATLTLSERFYLGKYLGTSKVFVHFLFHCVLLLLSVLFLEEITKYGIKLERLIFRPKS